MFIRTILFLFFVSLPFFSFSQKLEFEHLTDKDGLVHNSVTSILKDSYGYMWFGTFNGLSRYDGYNFTNYLKDAQDTSSLSDNSVRCVFESKERTLFIGLQFNGLCLYNRELETFTRLRNNPNDPKSLSNDNVLTIFEDKKGNTWIGTKGGLDKFNSNNRNFTHYTPPQEKNYYVSAISEDEDGNLWIYGRGDHVYKFNPENNSFESFIFTNGFENPFTWGGCLKYDSKGNVWIGSEGHGLFRYNPKTGQKDSYSTHNQKLKSDLVFSIIEDSEGKIWVGTDGGGGYIYNYETDSFQLFQHVGYDITSLGADAIYCIYQSDEEFIWIGTFNLGINIYKKNKHKFLKFNNVGEPGRCLNAKSVPSIIIGNDGKLWIGTDGGGLNYFDPKTFRFKYYNTENSIIHSNVIKTVYQDQENNLWLGSYGKGLCKLNLEKSTIEIFKGNIHSKGETILSNHVWDITESFDKKIWVGLLNYGINVFDQEKKVFSYYPFDTADFNQSSCNIHAVFEDSRRRMWIGSEKSGAGYYDPDNKTLISFKHQDGMPLTIGSNSIQDIFEDSKGIIWIATFEGGLNKLINAEKGQFKSYTIKDGLPTNNIQTILEDDHHHLWIATDKGISKFEEEKKKFTNFDIEDGLQSIQFNYCAVAKSKNGYMYFGGTEGFNMFHPDSIKFNITPPKIIITDFKLFNRSIRPNKSYNGKVYFTKAPSLSKEITLTHEDFIFSIEFAALDFTSPKKNKYAYRLQGLSDKWTYVNADKRFAAYTNLDPGKYIFQVIASNNDGIWTHKGISFHIIILPPWWMTWWFRSVVIVLMLICMGAFYYIRLRSIKDRNRFLEKEVQKQTAELKEANESLLERKVELEQLNMTKDKFFSIIGHDLKGPVKALTTLAEMLKEESASMINESQRLITEHIYKASFKVHNLVIALLEWARTQSGQVKLSPEIIPVLTLFRENAELLSEQASQKKIHLKIEEHVAHKVFGDYNMLSTIVRNILSNSIKYTPRQGTITLSSSRTEDNEIRLSIKDTGVGMSKDILDKLFSLEKGPSVKGTENEQGTGLGMIISKEFAELNNGKIYAESKEEEGTTFYVLLPSENSLNF